MFFVTFLAKTLFADSKTSLGGAAVLSDKTAGWREDFKKKKSKGKFDKFPDTNPHKTDVSPRSSLWGSDGSSAGCELGGQSLNAVTQSLFEVRSNQTQVY